VGAVVAVGGRRVAVAREVGEFAGRAWVNVGRGVAEAVAGAALVGEASTVGCDVEVAVAFALARASGFSKTCG
jgi:hypothetical protein